MLATYRCPSVTHSLKIGVSEEVYGGGKTVVRCPFCNEKMDKLRRERVYVKGKEEYDKEDK